MKIEKAGAKEFIVIVPKNWEKDDEAWQDLPLMLSDYIFEEGTIYINLANISSLSSYAFNRLFDLSSLLASRICRLVFMNVDEDLEERIAMLQHHAE